MAAVLARHTVAMAATVVMVLADSEAEAEELRARACVLLGLESMGKVLQPVGRERWMARATVVERVEQE